MVASCIGHLSGSCSTSPAFLPSRFGKRLSLSLSPIIYKNALRDAVLAARRCYQPAVCGLQEAKPEVLVDILAL